MKRLLFLGLLIMMALVCTAEAFAQSSTPSTLNKDAMLHALVTNVIVPGYERLDSKCRELTNAIEELTKAPDQTLLDRTCEAWRGAAQAADSMRCFQKGPIADHDYISSFYFWQILPARIETILGSDRPINPMLIEELGATAKGMFALEYLLFDSVGRATKTPSALESLSGTQGQRRRIFLLALAQDLQAKAAQLATDWKATDAQSASAKFVKAGQESVNILVNQLALSMESIAEQHLNFVLVLPSPIAAQLERVERSRSSGSLEGVLAALEGTRQLYRGGEGPGLDDAMKQVNAPAQKRLDEQFDAAVAAVRAIAKPLEQAVSEDRAVVQRAYEKTHALEILFKVDLASALGVTLTFSSADGD